MSQPEETIVNFKQFSDFKRLDTIIKLSCYNLDESGHYMPVLPSKRNALSGNKKSGDELQFELVEYMRDLLKIPLLQRMYYLRLFLSVNEYHPNVSEQTFNDMSIMSPRQATG